MIATTNRDSDSTATDSGVIYYLRAFPHDESDIKEIEKGLLNEEKAEKIEELIEDKNGLIALSRIHNENPRHQVKIKPLFNRIHGKDNRLIDKYNEKNPT